MSTALQGLKLKETRPKQDAAGVGATLAYNMVIRDALPGIVAELEKKIADLQSKVDDLASTSSKPAGTGLSAVRALHRGGRRTRRSSK